RLERHRRPGEPARGRERTTASRGERAAAGPGGDPAPQRRRSVARVREFRGVGPAHGGRVGAHPEADRAAEPEGRVMIVVQTTFPLPAGTTPEQFEDWMLETVSHYRSVPGLLHKCYVRDAESNTGGGLYTFEDAAQARA